VAGAEVAQLYVTLPSSVSGLPPKQLRGFAKLKLEAGKSGVVSFKLRRRDLSFWDVGRQGWVVPTGEVQVAVGASSRDLRLTGAITV
jgi:beta-glucosidase